MKIFSLEPPASSISDLLLRADNVLINSGKELYCSDWMGELSFLPVLIIKMAKVAKAVDPLYVERYYEVASLGIDLRVSEMREELPAHFSYSFDYSLVRGEQWWGLDEIKGLAPKCVRTISAEVSHEELPPINFPTEEEINKCIALVSRYYLIKIGDIITLPLWSEYRMVKPRMGLFIVDDQERELVYYGIK